MLLTEDDVLAAIGALSVWERRGVRAPHKPLLLLLAMGRLLRGEQRLMVFNDLEEPLRELLRNYGPARTRYHPECPFWHLRSDGLWELPAGDDLPLRKGAKNPPASVLRDRRVEGGLPAPVFDLLRERPRLVQRVAMDLLWGHFPASLHGEISAAVGLDLEAREETSRLPRDPAFAAQVMWAYEGRCAMCGFRAMLDGEPLGVEAAHVRWHTAGGPARVNNGLALCAVHHRLFDRGALGIDVGHRVLVSTHVRWGEEEDLAMGRLQGAPVAAPRGGLERVAEPHIRWHQREVFRGGDPAASSA